MAASLQSKTWRSLVASLAFLAIALTARAQYSIDWSTIDGGGGTSTSRVYSVSGSNKPIVVPATLPTKFYRLFKP